MAGECNMKGKEQKIANWIANNIIAIIALLFEAFPVLISHLRSKEVSWRTFLTIIIIPVLFCIHKIYKTFQEIYKQYKRFKAYRKKIEDEVKQYGETLKYNYSYCKEKSRKKFIAKCRIILVKKCLALFVFIVAIACVCVCNPQNAYAFWDKIVGFASKEDSSSVESDKDNADNELKEAEETTQEIRDIEWRFILSESDYSFGLDPQLEKQVFFETDKSSTEWEEYVQEIVDQWKGEKEGVNYATIKDDDGNSFFTYTKMEDKFKERVEDASQYIYFDDWLKEAPHSFECDEYIEGRETLNKIEIDGKTGCYEIWWKLANDYQYYAQEYERQTANAEAILYYYAKSIYCCMEALKYSVSEEEYNTTYHNMVMRYHDIYRDECIISQEYKEKANSIFSILVKSDVKWITNK